MMNARAWSLFILLVIYQLCIGCGESSGPEVEYNRKVAIAEQARVEAFEKLIAPIRAKYNPINLSEQIKRSHYTYEFQQLAKQRPLLFNGCIEDVEETKNGVFISVSYRHGYMSPVFLFRLKADQDLLQQVLAAPRPYQTLLEGGYSDKQIYVVATISDVRTVQYFAVEIEPAENESSPLSGNNTPRGVATGTMHAIVTLSD